MNNTDRECENKLLQKYFVHVYKSDPILGKIEIENDIHPGGIRYQKDERELVTQKTTFSTTLQMSFDEISNYDIEAFAIQVYQFACEYLKQIHVDFIKKIDAITSLTGNKLDAKGKEFSIDLIIDMLQQMDIGFDDDGNPKFPQAIIPPKVFDKIKGKGLTKEQNARLEAIIEDKKRRYYARICYRRLSYID